MSARPNGTPRERRLHHNDIPLSPDEHTLAKAFKSAGYHTAYIGKWHLGGERAEPFGFEHSIIWTETNAHWDKSRFYPANGDPVQPKGYNATLMTDQARLAKQHGVSAPTIKRDGKFPRFDLSDS